MKQFKQSKFCFVELGDSYYYKTVLVAKHIDKVKGSENILVLDGLSSRSFSLEDIRWRILFCKRVPNTSNTLSSLTVLNMTIKVKKDPFLFPRGGV